MYQIKALILCQNRHLKLCRNRFFASIINYLFNYLQLNINFNETVALSDYSVTEFRPVYSASDCEIRLLNEVNRIRL